MSAIEELFHPLVELPDDVRRDRYARLVGIDHIKDRLRKQAIVLADPGAVDRWAREHHRLQAGDVPALALLRDRAPLLLFAGDVGSGKTALAESFGCDLADHLGVGVTLYRLKLTSRGTGHVGEMTTLVSTAFETVVAEAKMLRRKDGTVEGVIVLVIDEADALVQSREATQMHHEDRAGVDAFLAGIDEFAGSSIPLLVVMCTNRLAALDPAVRRRAASTFEFARPDAEQRRSVLTASLEGFSVDPMTIEKLVDVTGGGGDRAGFTYSDISQRLVPNAVLAAYPDGPLTDEVLLAIAEEMSATPAFDDRAAT